MPIVSANVIACEDVLTEKTDIFSAVKILSAYNVSRQTTHMNLYSLATAFCTPGDYSSHVMSVHMKTPEGLAVATGADYSFNYGYKIDPLGYGGFSLKTKFSLDLSKVPAGLGWFFCGSISTESPLLRRFLRCDGFDFIEANIVIS